MKTSSTHRLTVSLPSEIIAALSRIAQQDDRTVTASIRQLLKSDPRVQKAINETPKIPCPVTEVASPAASVALPVLTNAPVVPAAPVVPRLRGHKEYIASGGLNDDCTTVGGPLRVRATGELLDINR